MRSHLTPYWLWQKFKHCIAATQLGQWQASAVSCHLAIKRKHQTAATWTKSDCFDCSIMTRFVQPAPKSCLPFPKHVQWALHQVHKSKGFSKPLPCGVPGYKDLGREAEPSLFIRKVPHLRWNASSWPWRDLRPLWASNGFGSTAKWSVWPSSLWGLHMTLIYSAAHSAPLLSPGCTWCQMTARAAIL